MNKLEFIFDIGSPNAYLSMQVLPQLCARYDVELVITPVLLGGIFKLTNNQPPMVAFGAIKNKPEYEMLEIKRFIEFHGITAFKMNPHFPVNTLYLMRAMIVAQMMGREADYLAAICKGMWEDGLKLDDPEVLDRFFNDHGFDADKMRTDMSSEDVKKKLMENTDNAVARGCFGIPSFFFNGDLYFGKDRLIQIETLLSRAPN